MAEWALGVFFYVFEMSGVTTTGLMRLYRFTATDARKFLLEIPVEITKFECEINTDVAGFHLWHGFPPT